MDPLQNVQGGSSIASQLLVVQSSAVNPGSTEVKTETAATDTVQISAAARAALQQSQAQESTLQQASESRFKTTQEAAQGDLQAKQLLAQQDQLLKLYQQ